MFPINPSLTMLSKMEEAKRAMAAECEAWLTPCDRMLNSAMDPWPLRALGCIPFVQLCSQGTSIARNHEAGARPFGECCTSNRKPIAPTQMKHRPMRSVGKSKRRARTPIITPLQKEALAMQADGFTITEIALQRGTSREAVRRVLMRGHNNEKKILAETMKILAERRSGKSVSAQQLRSDPPAKQPPKSDEE